MANMYSNSSEKMFQPVTKVIGVGGAGNNAVNNMINYGLEGVDFIVANTDAQSLSLSPCTTKIQLGASITSGLGAGSSPETGRYAAQESIEEITEALKDSNIVFITAGMGGGTGTGAAPVIAQCAKEMGIITVGVVTKPFKFEGQERSRSAEQGIAELKEYVDTLIVVSNQNLFRVATQDTSFTEAFKMADNVLYNGVKCITDLFLMPGLINLDLADVTSIIAKNDGMALMGVGEAFGPDRAEQAASGAITNPLLEDLSVNDAKGILINVTGGPDMTLFEVDEVVSKICKDVDSDVKMIFGAIFNESMEGSIRVSVVATGVQSEGESKEAKNPATKEYSLHKEMTVPNQLNTNASQSDQDFSLSTAEETSSSPGLSFNEEELNAMAGKNDHIQEKEDVIYQPKSADQVDNRTAESTKEGNSDAPVKLIDDEEENKRFMNSSAESQERKAVSDLEFDFLEDYDNGEEEEGFLFKVMKSFKSKQRYEEEEE